MPPAGGWQPPQPGTWGRAPGSGPLDWKAIGTGAGAMAVCMVTTFHTFVKSQVTQALQSNQEMSLIPTLLVCLAIAAMAGAATVHASPTRSKYEAAVAGLLGIWAALLVLSVAPPTIQTAYGVVPLFNLTFGWFVLDSLIYPAAAYGGGHYYAEQLRKKGP